MKKIGLIINPVAGIGGKVGLKGSDGKEILAKAIDLGAKPESNNKAKIALGIISQLKDEVEIYTYPKEMGADAAREWGFTVHELGSIISGQTCPADTEKAAKDLRDANVDFILFAGGDGTARNILDAVGTTVPAIGIPAGCKIHSAVYALNPKSAGEIVLQYLQGKIKDTRESEVMDIDEDLFRQNVVQAKLYGYLKILNERKMVQNLKSGRGFSETGSISMISNYISDTLQDDTLYIIGPGSTTRSIMETAGLPNTLLGVDLFCNRKIIANDVTEKIILEQLEKYDKVKIIVTVIGGQGYIFGRGNQQISAAVIEKAGKQNIMIAASKDKMLSLFGKSLYVDTGDEMTNKMLCGYYKVIVGYEDYMMFKVTD